MPKIATRMNIGDSGPARLVKAADPARDADLDLAEEAPLTLIAMPEDVIANIVEHVSGAHPADAAVSRAALRGTNSYFRALEYLQPEYFERDIAAFNDHIRQAKLPLPHAADTTGEDLSAANLSDRFYDAGVYLHTAQRKTLMNAAIGQIENNPSLHANFRVSAFEPLMKLFPHAAPDERRLIVHEAQKLHGAAQTILVMLSKHWPLLTADDKHALSALIGAEIRPGPAFLHRLAQIHEIFPDSGLERIQKLALEGESVYACLAAAVLSRYPASEQTPLLSALLDRYAASEVTHPLTLLALTAARFDRLAPAAQKTTSEELARHLRWSAFSARDALSLIKALPYMTAEHREFFGERLLQLPDHYDGFSNGTATALVPHLHLPGFSTEFRRRFLTRCFSREFRARESFDLQSLMPHFDAFSAADAAMIIRAIISGVVDHKSSYDDEVLSHVAAHFPLADADLQERAVNAIFARRRFPRDEALPGLQNGFKGLTPSQRERAVTRLETAFTETLPNGERRDFLELAKSLGGVLPYMTVSERKIWLDRAFAKPVDHVALAALAPAMQHLTRAEEDAFRAQAAHITDPEIWLDLYFPSNRLQIIATA